MIVLEYSDCGNYLDRFLVFLVSGYRFYFLGVYFLLVFVIDIGSILFICDIYDIVCCCLMIWYCMLVCVYVYRYS